MTIVHKTLAAVVATIVVLVALLSFFWRDTLLDSYASFERVEMTRQVERAFNALREDTQVPSLRLNDWAAWDSTWRFVAGEEPGYIVNNFPEPITMAEMGFHYTVFLRTDASIKHALAIDTQDGKHWRPLPSWLGEHLKPGSPLLAHRDHHSKLAALIQTPTGVAQVGSHPITRGDYTGDIRGTMIFATELQPTEVQRLAELIHVPFEALPLHTTALSEPQKVALATLERGKEGQVELAAIDEQTLVGHALMRDVYGKPAVLIAVRAPRTLYAQGRDTVRQSLTLLAISGTVFALLNIFLLRGIVLQRLARLSEQVAAIGSVGSLAARVDATGGDEIATVASKVNGMLSQLERSQAAILELEAWRKGEQRYTELMDAAPALVLIVTEGQLLYANPYATRVLGLPADASWKGRAFSSLLATEESRGLAEREFQRLAAAELEVARMELKGLGAQGEVLDLEVAANRMVFADRPCLQVIAQDVTEANRVQDQLTRMGQEMEIATRIQTALVPTDMPIERFDIAMSLQTAAEVGGDLIDYIPQPDGRFWLAIGDVTGHGLTPGLVMMMAQSLITGYVLDAPLASPAERLVRINQALYQNVRNRMRNDNYMTLQLIHHQGDGHFVAAGMHCDILVWRAASGSVERIEVPGFWTGLMPDIAEMTHDTSFFLGPSDVMLLYSDGLIEASNAQQEQFDMARLEEALARRAHLPVGEIQAAILADVQAWLHEQLDDISVIVLRRHAEVPAHPEAVRVILT